MAEQKNGSKQKKHNNVTILVYRWILYLFAAVFSLNGNMPQIRWYAVLETLAVAAIYNLFVTAYLQRCGKKFSVAIVYCDVVLLMLLIFFSSGIRSELYIFFFFLIGLSGIYSDISNTVKIGMVIAALYTAACILSGQYKTEDAFIISLIIKDFLILSAAYAVTRINFEVKKSDELIKKEFRIARTDKLTGLANRHYFEQKLKEEVEYADKNGSVLNVLLFDLDNFKGFNDTYGHLSGDKLLMLFSDIIRQCIRRADIPVRYGGEEFVILIRDLDSIIAKSVGDRIRRQLEKQRIHLGSREERRKVTVSCGVAQYPTHSKSIKEVLEKADQALYYAKSIGKNIVVTVDEIGQPRESLENDQLRLV
jgi:diguanylate cyclase (GGDEF)-like protein